MKRSAMSPTIDVPEISVVIPCYNEEENVVAIAAAVAGELQSVGATYEIIFIDNASTDRTVELARGLCEADLRVKLIVNNRNYGQMRSPTYGIYQTSGRAVIAMCADFQDTPSLVPIFIQRWRAGAAIALGVRASERAPAGVGLGRKIAYGFLSRFADYEVIPGATGFGIYDRRVVDALAEWREPEPFFRGMLVESGFPIEVIPYDRPDRAGGTSKNNFMSLLSFAISGLASSSKSLLRMPLYVAAALVPVVAVTVLLGVLASALGGDPGQWLLALVVQVLFAVNFAFLGLIGEHVRLIAERSRDTPLVIENARYNF